MRLALAQINPTVGDIDANAALIAAAAALARGAGADLLVCPELGLSGYPPMDLLWQEGFLGDCVAAAKTLGEQHSAGLTLVFGVPLAVSGDGNDLSRGIHNSLLAYRDGKMVAYYDKRLLPTYDVFDENRYFVPGNRAVVIDVPSRDGPTMRVGLSICEDLWKGEDAGFAHRYMDCADPVAELVGAQKDGGTGAQVIINPSASPFVLGKGRRHRDILRRHAMRHGVFVAGVNQVGGNDELIFDGHGAVFAPGGELIGAAPGFEEHLLVVDLPGDRTPIADPVLDTTDEESLYRALVLGVRDYCRKTGFASAIIGLSGGIDSAVVAVIAAAALGPANITGVSMPGPYSSEGSKTDAAELAARLGIRMLTVPIGAGFEALTATLRAGSGPVTGIAEENLQSRLRGTTLMAISNQSGAMVLTTGNKSELAVGYCTLYGDMNGGLAVLSDVTKLWVYRLARWINANPPPPKNKLGLTLRAAGATLGPIPQATITKPPSAELRPGQTDEASLGPYAQLDEIIERTVEKRQSPERIVRETGFDAAAVKKIVRLIDLSEYKRKQAAIGLKVTGVAFGAGRRFPNAQRYRPWEGMVG